MTEPLDARRWHQLREIVEAALDVDVSSRAAWLEDACGADPSLRAEVQRLLDADRHVGAQLRQGARRLDDVRLDHLARGTAAERRRAGEHRVGEASEGIQVGAMVGGGIEIWFAYVLALLFLLVRPQGLFGEKIIDRV